MLDDKIPRVYHIETMTSGIEIQEDMIKGLVPELKNPDVLARSHRLASENNPLLHFIHVAMMVGFKRSTNYDSDAIEAINLGAESYEGLSIATGDQIPVSFCLAIIAKREKDHNFGIRLAEQMTDAREELLFSNRELALGIYSVSAAYTERPELASTYGIGGAALMHSAHSEVYDFWQLEKEIWPDDIV